MSSTAIRDSPPASRRPRATSPMARGRAGNGCRRCTSKSQRNRGASPSTRRRRPKPHAISGAGCGPLTTRTATPGHQEHAVAERVERHRVRRPGGDAVSVLPFSSYQHVGSGREGSCGEFKSLEGGAQLGLEVDVVLVEGMDVLGRSTHFRSSSAGNDWLEDFFAQGGERPQTGHGRGDSSECDRCARQSVWL